MTMHIVFVVEQVLPQMIIHFTNIPHMAKLIAHGISLSLRPLHITFPEHLKPQNAIDISYTAAQKKST